MMLAIGVFFLFIWVLLIMRGLLWLFFKATGLLDQSPAAQRARAEKPRRARDG